VKPVRILYRLRQFWHTLTSNTISSVSAQALALLSLQQKVLFDQLQPGEKSHALEMARKLMEQGELQSDLLVAAMLHDIGKLQYPLHPIERAMVIIVKAASPSLAARIGCLPEGGWENVPWWRKAFVLAEHHAAWGADLARQSGVSPLAEILIREHHHPISPAVNGIEDSLLHKLWLVDNES
jgi:putative nucleotidyltransferase with HDIG domain